MPFIPPPPMFDIPPPFHLINPPNYQDHLHDHAHVYNHQQDLAEQAASHQRNAIADHLTANNMFRPKFDMRETVGSYIVEGEFPGAESKNIIVEISGGQTLNICGHVERDISRRSAAIEAGEASSSTANGATRAHAGSGNAASQHEQQTRYLLQERMIGKFHRDFEFPALIDCEKITAKLENGILKVIVPKLNGGNPIKIEVN
ncbi:hypothetical protein RUND412_004454 [Rhizina undulata]